MMRFLQPFVRQCELARALQVSDVTIRNWRKRGYIPEPEILAHHYVVWPREVINEWLDNLQNNTTTQPKD